MIYVTNIPKAKIILLKCFGFSKIISEPGGIRLILKAFLELMGKKRNMFFNNLGYLMLVMNLQMNCLIRHLK